MRRHVVARAYPPRFGDERAVPAFSREDPPSGPGWIHEIKHDGFRNPGPAWPGRVVMISAAFHAARKTSQAALVK
jgi:hypothetical protein